MPDRDHLQDSLPEEKPSDRNAMEPHIVVSGGSKMVEIEEKMLIRAEFEVPAPQNEPEREEVDIESGDKMSIWAKSEVSTPRIPDTSHTTLTGQTGLPEAPMSQEVADSDPMVIEQADIPVSEAGLDLDRPVTPELSKGQVQNQSMSRRRHGPPPVPISFLEDIVAKRQSLIHLFNPTKPYLRQRSELSDCFEACDVRDNNAHAEFKLNFIGHF